MNSFDINCMLGPTSTNREPSFRTAEALLAEMDRIGIADALVYASQARMAHPSDGNARILEMTRGHSRLHACWVVMPPGTREQPEPRAFVEQMNARGVRAVRMFPEEHRYPLVERALRPLLAELAEAGIPLLIDTGRTSWNQIRLDWREIFAIAEAHPALPLVLLREGGTTQRALFGLWDEFPSIHLDTSYIQESRIVEEVTERFGHGRLLFGTGMPAYDPGGPMALVQGAQITQEQRADIAGNNLRRLIGLPAKEAEKHDWPCGPGRFQVFDVHGHLGLWERKYTCDRTAEDVVERMDQVGVERCAVSDIQAVGPDFRAGNDRVGAAVEAFPDRLVGYVVYNPNYGLEMADEMKRGFDELGCRGIKFHCTLHDTATEDPLYRPGFRTAQQQGCPILCHGHLGPSPEFLMQILADHPDAKFIYAHIGGGTREGLKPFLDVAHARPNLFFDLAGSGMPRGALAWVVDQVPPTQVVYGSDFPLNGFTFQLGRVLHANIADTLKRLILWSNAAGIFGL
ncbi:MAG: amidohydrolase family protein [Planctomycetota bacterium]|nr:amidohydrolase family protein [Planctomycetota bacterium]